MNKSQNNFIIFFWKKKGSSAIAGIHRGDPCPNSFFVIINQGYFYFDPEISFWVFVYLRDNSSMQPVDARNQSRRRAFLNIFLFIKPFLVPSELNYGMPVIYRQLLLNAGNIYIAIEAIAQAFK